MNSPILICGCPGSGTSLVTKILRHAGLFTGADSGPFDARKYHESQSFKQYNIQFLTQTIDFPHAPKSVEQFKNHSSRMQQRLQQLAQLVDRNQLLSEFSGVAEGLSLTQPWGWKDPRNSATAMVWKEIFPDLKAIVIRRNWRWRDRWRSGGSDSGNWYRRHSTAELRELYENPIGINPDSLLQVDVNHLTSDADCLANVLTWCNLSSDPVNDFAGFLTRVGVDR